MRWKTRGNVADMEGLLVWSTDGHIIGPAQLTATAVCETTLVLALPSAARVTSAVHSLAPSDAVRDLNRSTDSHQEPDSRKMPIRHSMLQEFAILEQSSSSEDRHG